VLVINNILLDLYNLKIENHEKVLLSTDHFRNCFSHYNPVGNKF
jgi:hypothetical protein